MVGSPFLDLLFLGSYRGWEFFKGPLNHCETIEKHILAVQITNI